MRARYGDETDVIESVEKFLNSQATAEAGGDVDAYREALALWLDTVAEVVKKPAAEVAFDRSLLSDFDAPVLVRGAAE